MLAAQPFATGNPLRAGKNHTNKMAAAARIAPHSIFLAFGFFSVSCCTAKANNPIAKTKLGK